ncbi:MAG: hypothetical protein K0Q79_2856 [Flavipsychrobacter sp.]|jgi:gliding motility-associated-like protein|nr:hypothetical protein [Flavipsychrobacter sp.]
MRYFLSLLILIFSFSGAKAQIISITDTPHCFYHGLHAGFAGGIVPISSGITVDDGWSGVIPIGFTFNFYGTPYTQCVIGSNGCLGFNLASAGAYNTWPIGTTLAATTSADIRNVICGPWCDVLLAAGGTIEYSTQGVAPNRNFAVTWCGTGMYSCTSEWLTTQIIIYETTGIIEVHLGHRTICSTGWNGSRAIIGVKNAAGTVSTTPPTRDFAPTWIANNEAWRFTSIFGPSYSVASIPYAPIPYASSAVYWRDSTTGVLVGTGPSLSVAPTVPTTYEASVLGCKDTTKAYIRVSVPTGLTPGGLPSIDPITGSHYTHPTVCGKCDGEIVLHGIKPHQVDTLYHTKNGIWQPVIIDSALLDSTIHLTGLCEATYDNFFLKYGDCPSDTVGPVVFTTPPINSSFGYSADLRCDGDVVTFWNYSTPKGSEYNDSWTFGDGATSTAINPVHTYSLQGTYTVTLRHASNYATATTCFEDTTINIPLIHPIDAQITYDANEVCLGMPIRFTGLTVSNDMPSFTWQFGAGDSAEYQNPIDFTYKIPGRFMVTFTVKDSIGCIATDIDSVTVISVDVRTRVHDTSVCLVDSMEMAAFVKIIPDDISYQLAWTPTNNIGATTGPTTKFFGIGDYMYTVTLTTPPLTLNPNGCIATDTQAIHSYPPVVLTDITASPVTIPYGSSIQLNAKGAVYYTWTPADGSLTNNNINNPIASPKDVQTVYTVYGMNFFGCLDSAKVIVNVDKNIPEGVPTAFTPNGDGMNDVFMPSGLTFQNMVEFRVFNRWGQEVFMTNNPKVGWDGTFHGTKQDMGTYNWIIILGHVDGTNKVYKGDVTLIR